MGNSLVKYESASGQPIQFTAEEVRQRLCPNIDDRELAFLMALCQAQKLNPFTKDVHIIKYGSGPATLVTSKEVFTKRAQANPRFEGMQAGITVVSNGQVVRREGSMMLQGESLAGGWCKVFVKGYRVPIMDEVSLAEYSTGKNNWTKMPATMIRKVAMCHALREAFPDDFQGLYGEEEMGVAVDGAQPAPQAAAPAKATPQAAQEPQAPKPPDPRKHLWDRAGKLHAEAVSLGVRTEGIDSWMAASILRPDGTPKPKPDYTDMDLYALCDYLEAIARDARAVKEQTVYEVPDAADEIPF